jgi:hypothetical protein
MLKCWLSKGEGTMKKSLGMVLSLVLLAVSVSGCVALAVGAAAGVGGYAWVNGELVKEYQVSAEKLQRAATRGLKSQNVVISDQQGDRLSAKISGKFADGKKIAIAIEAMTEKSSKMKIRVGMFGDQTRSELIANAIEKNL